jgi:hypothetical protein
MKTTPHSTTEREAVLAVKELFQNAIVDEIIPHDQIMCLVKQYYPNAPEGYGYTSVRSIKATVVRKVRKIRNDEAGEIFVCVHGQGYRRLDQTNGVFHAGAQPLIRTRRLMKESYKQLSNALRHSNDITPNDKRKAIQRMATFGLIQHLTLDKTVVTMPEEPNRIDPLKPLRDSLGI